MFVYQVLPNSCISASKQWLTNLSNQDSFTPI